MLCRVVAITMQAHPAPPHAATRYHPCKAVPRGVLTFSRASSKRAPFDPRDGLALASELSVTVPREQTFILVFDGQIALARPCF
jgi:hypothetical protein